MEFNEKITAIELLERSDIFDWYREESLLSLFKEERKREKTNFDSLIKNIISSDELVIIKDLRFKKKGEKIVISTEKMTKEEKKIFSFLTQNKNENVFSFYQVLIKVNYRPKRQDLISRISPYPLRLEGVVTGWENGI